MPNNIIITPGSASIQFSGSANNDTIRLQVEASGSVAFYGNSGSLFSIVDQLSGSLMSVNDISGLPILEVFSDDRVVMGTFGRNSLVVTGSKVGVSTNSPQLTTSVVFDVDGTSAFRQVVEHTDIRNTAASATTINYDLLTGSILWYSVSSTGNWTLNFRGTSATSLNSIMEIGQSTAAVFIANNGVVAYAPTAHQIDGTAITPKWQGGSAATAKTNSIEMYSYVIMKTADATFTLFASKLDFA